LPGHLSKKASSSHLVFFNPAPFLNVSFRLEGVTCSIVWPFPQRLQVFFEPPFPPKISYQRRIFHNGAFFNVNFPFSPLVPQSFFMPPGCAPNLGSPRSVVLVWIPGRTLKNPPNCQIPHNWTAIWIALFTSRD